IRPRRRAVDVLGGGGWRPFVRRDLDGDALAGLTMARAVHLPHAACTGQVFEGVLPDVRPARVAAHLDLYAPTSSAEPRPTSNRGVTRPRTGLFLPSDRRGRGANDAALAKECYATRVTTSRFAPKPPWLKVRAPGGPAYGNLKATFRALDLHTV